MIRKYSFKIFKPHWPKWKIKIADFFLFRFTYLKVAFANRILKKYGHLKDKVFIDEVMKEIGLVANPIGLENIPKKGAVTLVSNHPGGADVIATISVLGSVRDDFVILANKLVCVEPVAEIVLPVNVESQKNKLDMDQVRQAYKDGKLIVFYAAGKNSRYNEEGLLRDRKWRTTFLDLAMEFKTPIIVSHIGGKNSQTFYKVSRIRSKYKRLRKIPLENIFQLRELVRAKGNLKMLFSKPIPYSFFSEKLLENDVKLKRELADKMRHFNYALDEQMLDFQAYIQDERSSKS